MHHPRVHAWFVALLSSASLASGPAPPVPKDSPPPVPDAAPAPVPTDSPSPAAPPARVPVPSVSPPPAPGPADGEPERLAVVRPVLVGFADRDLADAIAGQLVAAMQHGQTRALPRDAVDRIAANTCDEGCLRALRAGLGADKVVRTTISYADRDYVVHLELVDGRTREVVSTREATCELCSANELPRFAAIQVAGLVGAIAPTAQPKSRLRLDSLPAGARVYVDGRLLGMTPFDAEVATGEHVVRVDLDDHISELRRLSASPGVQERIHVVLRRVPAAPATARRAGFAILFPGLVASMAGLSMLAIDGHPVRSRCTGVDIDAGGDCHYRFNTDAGGAVLLSAGALLMTASVLLLVPPRHARKTRLRAGLGGAGLVLRGAF